MKEVQVFIEIEDESMLPFYANEGDAGMDLRASEDVIIGCGETVLVPSSFKVAIPIGYEIQVRPRSGISLKTPLRVTNSPGTIDSLYRGEVKTIIHNTSAKDTKWNQTNLEKGGEGIYHIKKGDRIAQIVLNEVPKIKWERIENILDVEGNRNSGFGGSGVK